MRIRELFLLDSLACCDMLVGWVFINVIDVRQLGPSLKHVLLHALIEYDLKKVAIVSQQDFLYKKNLSSQLLL